MKKRIFSILLIVSLLCTLVIANTAFAANDDIVPTTDDAVSQSEADNVATYWLKESSSTFSTWDGAKLSAPVTYYSVEDTSIPVAYEYTVLNEGKSVGFMIVSALKSLSPVLEFSDGKAPSSYLDNAEEFANKEGFVTDKTSPLILYWGGLTYAVQYGDQMKEKGVAIHLPTGRLQNVPDSMKLQIDADQARASWDELINNSNIKSSKGDVIISGVPAYYQSGADEGYGDDGDGAVSFPACAGSTIDPWDAWDGCSCIAGAMIHGYWDSHGYSNLPDGEDTLIDYNHHYMTTTYGGSTAWWLIDNGIRDIFDLCGYDFDVNNTTGTNWNDITTQVNANNPAVMSFSNNSHSTTLVGYQTAYLGNSVILHNTWDTSTHYLAYGDWDICQMTKVEES
ncbi:MAG: C39 family peptidase [Dehalococcoidales bacterium]|nr:C39 family peptidase [Dehalococcoidales bacterium]